MTINYLCYKKEQVKIKKINYLNAENSVEDEINDEWDDGMRMKIEAKRIKLGEN